MGNFKSLHMNKSPFYKDSHHGKYIRGKQNKKVDFRIPKTAYDDLMKYFKGMGMTKTEGFNQLVSDKLAMINTSKRTNFNNVEAIMLIPHSNDIMEINKKSEIIALYNTQEDFIEEYNYLDGFDKSFNYRYDLKLFCEDFFPMNIINSTKESPVYRVNKNDLSQWDSLYSRLDELYGLEGSEWDFVRFPLNNYLDVNREGQFQSENYRGTHEGIYIFDDFNHKRLFCFINWNYSLESKLITFDFYFLPMVEFMSILKKADFKTLRESYGDLINSNYNREQIEKMIENTKDSLDFLERCLEKA